MHAFDIVIKIIKKSMLFAGKKERELKRHLNQILEQLLRPTTSLISVTHIHSVKNSMLQVNKYLHFKSCGKYILHDDPYVCCGYYSHSVIIDSLCTHVMVQTEHGSELGFAKQEDQLEDDTRTV